MRLRGTDIYSGKSLDVYATIITDPTSSSNGRPVLLVEGLYGEMIEMDHANFALCSYCVAEATDNGRSVSRSPIITDPATDLPGSL